MRVRVQKAVDGKKRVTIVPARRAMVPPQTLVYTNKEEMKEALLPLLEATARAELPPEQSRLP